MNAPDDPVFGPQVNRPLSHGEAVIFGIDQFASLRAGGIYKVRFRLDGQRRDREMTARLLETTATSALFSLRPEAGTLILRYSELVSVQEMAPGTSGSLPVIVRPGQ